NLCATVPDKLLELPDELVQQLLSGIEMLLRSGDHVTAEAAALCIGHVMESPNATFRLYQSVKHAGDMEEIVNGLTHMMQGSYKVLLEQATKALQKVFRGQHGEALLARFIVPLQPQRGGFLGIQQSMEPVIEEHLPANLRSLRQNLVAGLLCALSSDNPAVAGGAAEILCVWIGVPEPGWSRILIQEQTIIIRILSGLTHLMHCHDAGARRNAAIVLHCFALDEKGVAYLSLMDPADLRFFLGGLRNLSQTSADDATAELCGRTLRELEDYGPPCWRRWITAITVDAPIVTYPQWENPQHTRDTLSYNNPYRT
ncbi:hypothetical protein CYMTET_51668, partial [Cymbomonas tetramitiformis]